MSRAQDTHRRRLHIIEPQRFGEPPPLLRADRFPARVPEVHLVRHEDACRQAGTGSGDECVGRRDDSPAPPALAPPSRPVGDRALASRTHLAQFLNESRLVMSYTSMMLPAWSSWGSVRRATGSVTPMARAAGGEGP